MEVKSAKLAKPKSSRLPDFIFISLCVIGAITSVYFFWKDLNGTLSRLNAESVGTVTYKYKAAQRRFVDRVLWDRLKQQSPVYDGDTLRTAQDSQATVTLQNGATIELHEKTLLYLRMSRLGGAVQLEEGGLTVDARSGILNINAAGAEVSASKDSVLELGVASGGLELAVLEGSAGVVSEAGKRNVSAGESIGSVRVSVTSPRQRSRYLNKSENQIPVNFAWTKSGFNTPVVIEIAADRGFNQVVETRESSATNLAVNLRNGAYFWRAYPIGESGNAIKQGSVSGQLQIISAVQPELVSPRQEELFSFRTARPSIRFQWAACEGASAYLIEIAANYSMANPVFSTQVQGTGGNIVSITRAGFQPGVFYWRVTPVYPMDVNGEGSSSVVANFIVEQAASLAVPELAERQSAVYLGSEPTNYFTWARQDDAASYTFLLSENEDLSNPLISIKVRDNYYALNIAEAGLAAGSYYWGVFQTDSEGNNSAASKSQALFIMAGTPASNAASAAKIEPVEAVTPVAPEPVVPVEPAQKTAVVAEKIEPLRAPQLIAPSSSFVVNEAFLASNKQIVFRWEAIPESSGYIFVIRKGKTELLRVKKVNGVSYNLTDLSVLDEGDLTWHVEAIPSSPGQTAQTANGRFKVQLEDVGKAEGNQSGAMFGTR